MKAGSPQILSLLLFAFLAPVLVSAQAKRGPSTPEERARAVEVAQSLRADPLSPANMSNREWLIKWLIEIPDISVKLCTDFLGDLGREKNSYPGELIASMMASEASFVIEHPDKSRDVNAAYLAGVDGALDSYQAIQKKTGSTASHISTNCCKCGSKESSEITFVKPQRTVRIKNN